MRVGFSRFDTKRCFKLLDCRIQIAGLRERRAKIHARGNAFRISRYSFAKLIHSLLIPLRLKRDLAATQVQTLSRDRLLQTVHERIENPNTDSSLLGQMRFDLVDVAQTAI